jgi:hypothetical protein
MNCSRVAHNSKTQELLEEESRKIGQNGHRRRMRKKRRKKNMKCSTVQ